jgi:hypothetical protein
MRIRYERRDPRPEDLRRIDELQAMVDSQEKDIYCLTEQLREMQLIQTQQQNNGNQNNSNQSNKRSKGKNNKNNRGNNNGNQNNVQQIRSNQQQSNDEQQQQQQQHNSQQQEEMETIEIKRPTPQRMKPPPLIKTVIYEEENENELYEEQLREERARQASEPIPIAIANNCTVELMPESPDYKTKSKEDEEISEALIVPENEILNQPVVPSPTPDHKNQEIAIEVISTIDASHIQVIPVANGLDLELD